MSNTESEAKNAIKKILTNKTLLPLAFKMFNEGLNQEIKDLENDKKMMNQVKPMVNLSDPNTKMLFQVAEGLTNIRKKLASNLLFSNYVTEILASEIIEKHSPSTDIPQEDQQALNWLKKYLQHTDKESL